MCDQRLVHKKYRWVDHATLDSGERGHARIPKPIRAKRAAKIIVTNGSQVPLNVSSAKSTFPLITTIEFRTISDPDKVKLRQAMKACSVQS